MEVLARLAWLVGHVVHVGRLKEFHGRMIEAAGEGEQDRQIGRTLQVEHPADLLRLHVVLESDVLERFRNLAATIIEPMRLADEGNQHVASGRFIEHHLGMTGRDDLAARFVRRLAQHLVTHLRC